MVKIGQIISRSVSGGKDRKDRSDGKDNGENSGIIESERVCLSRFRDLWRAGEHMGFR